MRLEDVNAQLEKMRAAGMYAGPKLVWAVEREEGDDVRAIALECEDCGATDDVFVGTQRMVCPDCIENDEATQHEYDHAIGSVDPRYCQAIGCPYGDH